MLGMEQAEALRLVREGLAPRQKYLDPEVLLLGVYGLAGKLRRSGREGSH
jgi:hypothetical protein